jgi:hypothetical protein
MRYAQRIDVDEWRYYVPDGVSVKVLNKTPPNELQLAVFGITKSNFDRIAKKLAGVRPDAEPDGQSGPELTKIAAQAAEEGYFSPATLQDERARRLREIVERRGQPSFRNKLIAAYDGRCAATGCDAVVALEAAHIVPYCGPQSNYVSNGLLFRADIHTLFDLQLMGIDPQTLTVALRPALQGTSYSELQGRRITLPTAFSEHPNSDALAQRWQRFSTQ